MAMIIRKMSLIPMMNLAETPTNIERMHLRMRNTMRTSTSGRTMTVPNTCLEDTVRAASERGPSTMNEAPTRLMCYPHNLNEWNYCICVELGTGEY